MRYCTNCRQVFNEEICPYCGSKKTESVEDNDFVFLINTQIIWGEAIKEGLRDNGIKSVAKPVQGAALALKTGPATERINVYVPFEHLTTAKELIRNFYDS